MFNMLVGPVFSAGSITSERERQSLDLLLTTIITPWQILWGKLVAGLRVSSVLTSFLLWPVLLACVMVSSYWTNLGAVAAYLAIVLVTCANTAMLALFCSVLFRKTSISLLTTYAVIIALFCAPLAVIFFTDSFFPDHYAEEPETTAVMRRLAGEGNDSQQIADQLFALEKTNRRTQTTRWRPEDVDAALFRARLHQWVPWSGACSPFVAAFETPLEVESYDDTNRRPEGSWSLLAAYLVFSVVMDALLLVSMIWLFNRRWRVSG
jgi:hypothetical protein